MLRGTTRHLTRPCTVGHRTGEGVRLQRSQDAREDRVAAVSFWADYLGALVWEEMPTAWRFTDEQNVSLEREWREAVERDVNHPCIITWVPFNEAWGLGIVFTPEIFIPAVLFPEQIEFMKHMVDITRQLDPTRLVIDNSGWDHTTATDVVDIHHYLPTLKRAAELYQELENLYSYGWTLCRLLEPGINNNIFTLGEGFQGQPVLISEYGGFGWYNWEEPGDVVEAYRRHGTDPGPAPHRRILLHPVQRHVPGAERPG